MADLTHVIAKACCSAVVVALSMPAVALAQGPAPGGGTNTPSATSSGSPIPTCGSCVPSAPACPYIDHCTKVSSAVSAADNLKKALESEREKLKLVREMAQCERAKDALSELSSRVQTLEARLNKTP